MPATIVTVEKLVFGGQALGRLPDGKVIFIWNALPGETVEVEHIKKKNGVMEGVATTIITASPNRVEPKDPHFLSSAPWEMISDEGEAEWKKNMAAEVYSKIGDMILSAGDLELVGNEHMYGYRNKMEFSFAHVDPSHDADKAVYHPTSLALFERGGRTCFPIESAATAEDCINQTAKDILDWVQEVRIPLRSLKSLIIRSNGAGETIAGIFLKDKLHFDTYPALTKSLVGFTAYYSTHKSPASVPTEELYTEGQQYLIADILGTKLAFGLLSFFQVNIPIFTKALKDIAAFLDPKKPLLDYYSGVGAIGLALSQNREHTLLVESNEEAAHYAAENIRENNKTNCEILCLPAEKTVEHITGNKSIIVDPPRAGLHEKVIQTLLKELPPQIIYLSCNLSTQARDIRMLSSMYKPVFIKLYNFFPKTPHIEGLVVLERV